MTFSQIIKRLFATSEIHRRHDVNNLSHKNYVSTTLLVVV